MRSVAALALVITASGAACRPPGYGREDPPDAADDASAVGADAASDAHPRVCHHAFRLDGQTTAVSVWLTGSFVSWAGDPQAGAVVFALGADGGWTGVYDFEPGTHAYKFIVNGNQWIADPTNPTQEDDGFGGTNSVYTCVP